MNYIFDNAVEPLSTQRLDSLAMLYDERTISFLERIGVRVGWHCLEVGSGHGSIASWLASRVDDDGSVLATDIDPRFLQSVRRRNIEVRRHDISLDPLPPDRFDLIHARLVLIHVVNPWRAVERLIAALKPGGLLLIEDFDPSLVRRDLSCACASDAALCNKVFATMRVLMTERGLDVDFARNLYSRLIAMGLVDVAMEGHVAVRPGGSIGARLDQANLAQISEEAIARKLLTLAEVERMAAALESNEFAVLSPVMFSAWGRKQGY
jgi:SAM-dependent methyltransferase